MELEIKKPQTITAKTLSLHLKVCDGFSANLLSDKGEVIHEQDDGYVPNFMPGKHYGDYVLLDIDIDTGEITNWVKPSKAEIQDWIQVEDLV